MATVFNNQTSDFDGSGSPVTATGSIAVTITGSLGTAEIKCYVSLDSGVSYAQVTHQENPGYFIIELPSSGAQFYFTLTGAVSGTDANLDYVFM